MGKTSRIPHLGLEDMLRKVEKVEKVELKLSWQFRCIVVKDSVFSTFSTFFYIEVGYIIIIIKKREKKYDHVFIIYIV
jgi:hypothetical protein